jgi:hypothetical protein
MSKTAQKEIADTKKTAKSLISLKIKRPTRKVIVQPAAPAPQPVSAPLPPL